jgi:chromosome segregation ATPase
MEVLRQYNETLFQSLTARMQELEREIGERRHAEDQVRRLNAELEERVRQRTVELEKVNRELKARAEELASFNRAMMGREQRVIELKEEVNRLSLELGRPPVYPPIWGISQPGGKH